MKESNHNVDDMGIRLAPTPLGKTEINQLPPFKQEFILRPSLKIDQSQDKNEGGVSTADDFQPKTKDIDKRWKRRKRYKNVLCGLIMFLSSAVVLLPYIFAVIGDVNLDAIPFKVVPTTYDVIGNYVQLFGNISALGWVGSEAAVYWKLLTPNLLLTVGLLFVLINMISAVFGVLGAVRPRKYVTPSIIYFVTVLALFVLSLMGAEGFGIPRIDFMQDFIGGWQDTELFTFLVTSAFGVLTAVICSIINPDKSGYMK